MDELDQSNGIMKDAEVEQKQNEKKNQGDRSTEVIQWERFLPRMVLRVLLVEADHSTRRIIAALLQKCGYKVTAVSDGLKAWETLKRKSHELDLILTEVDLPAISGFAVLTLITEHDICRNIPVIMMSAHDSVSMVYKCMLKGAADFLIKPVRKNELRNLWQHVWRRHGISMPPQNATFPQKKLKISSDDNSASNQSSGVASSKNNECSERLSDARSTCTLPCLEAETSYMENMQDVSQLESYSKLSNIDTVKHEEFSKSEGESADHNNETQEITVSEIGNKTSVLTDLSLKQDLDCAKTEIKDRIFRAEFGRENPNVIAKTCGCGDEWAESSKEAINLIATFKNLPKQNEENCSLTSGNTTKFDFDTQLERSLRTDFPGSSSKQAGEATEESQRLNRSNTSAFSWYCSSKLLQPLFPIPSITFAKVSGANWENMTSMIGQCGQDGPKLSNSQCGQLPVAGVISDLNSNGHCNVFTPVFCAQYGIQPMWNPKPVCHKESSPFPRSTTSESNPESHCPDQHHDWSNDTNYAYLNQNTKDKSDSNHARHDSPAAGHSGGNSMDRDAANGIHSDAYGSTGDENDGHALTMASKNYPESFSDSGGCHNSDGFRVTGSDRAIQRAAALTKFRLRRKDRCYEKKVRYHGRKRLAEQRPRVKGQFVRQVHNDHPVADAGGTISDEEEEWSA